MYDQKYQPISESAEMYLYAIERLTGSGEDRLASIPRLARELDVAPVSASQMVHRLSNEGLVEYTPYVGVRLTDEGRLIAARISRLRRLWLDFLVRKIGLPHEDALLLACRLEHITPQEVAEKLSAYVETSEERGQILPETDAREHGPSASFQRLDQIPAGQICETGQVYADPATRAFLQREGIRPGTKVRVLATSDQGTMLVESDGRRIQLTADITGRIIVRRCDETEPPKEKSAELDGWSSSGRRIKSRDTQ